MTELHGRSKEHPDILQANDQALMSAMGILLPSYSYFYCLVLFMYQERKTWFWNLEFIGNQRHFKGTLKKNAYFGAIVPRARFDVAKPGWLAVTLLMILALYPLSAQDSDLKRPLPHPFRLFGDFSGGAVILVSDSPSLTPLLHAGYGGKLGLEVLYIDRWAARLETSAFRITASTVGASGNLYRGWEGYSSSILAGTGFSQENITASFMVGAGVTAARYSGTDLVFAYPSLLARIGIRLDGSDHFVACIAIPVQIYLRGGTTGFSIGVEEGVSFDTGARR